MNQLFAACALTAVVTAGACSGGTESGQNTAAAPAVGQPGVPTPGASTAGPPAPLVATDASRQALAPMPAPATSPLPRQRTPEELMRAAVASWKNVPYRQNGTSRNGIGNAQLVRAVYRGAFDADIPAGYDQQIRTGKLVARETLAPGDLLFFEGKGLGPFKSKAVGIFVGQDQFAIADKDQGVVVARLGGSRWDGLFKTARRVSRDPSTAAPAFDAASYGSTGELLREVAKAWSGTLYRQGGTTFEGIGNEEFVQSLFEAIYDTELEGGTKQWALMGKPVKRSDLQTGDIILYEAPGLGQLVKQRHAGLYISDGDFVHAVRGSAVTISRLADPRWGKAFVTARRLDPAAIERAAERRAIPAPDRSAPAAGSGGEGSAAVASGGPPRDFSEYARQLREATEPWKGTPYKLGGTTKSGVDCSAFVRAVYEDVYGVDLPRTAEEQERLGTKVDRKNLASGDLVFFRTQGMGPFFKSRHVGIYLGGGEFAQASGSRGVNVSRLDSYYWNKKYEGARRLPKG